MNHHHPHTLIADFTTGNVNRQLVSFAMPMFLSHLLQIVYNMADMIIVGQTLGKVGLSAISVGGDIMNCMTFIAMGFSSAGQVLIAQYIGAKQHDKLSRFVATMSAALFGFACCVTGIGLLFRREIMELMHTPPEAFAEALSYAGISMAGIIFVYGYNAVSAILRGMGDAKHPFYFISLAALLNIVLDVIFVMQLGTGAKGAHHSQPGRQLPAVCRVHLQKQGAVSFIAYIGTVLPPGERDAALPAEAGRTHGD